MVRCHHTMDPREAERTFMEGGNMLSKKDNFLETIKGGKPDRFVKQFESFAVDRADPVSAFVRGERYSGMSPSYDAWGTRIIWPTGEPGATPDPAYKVIEDITEWRDFVKIPDLIANCSAEPLWAPYIERALKTDRSEQMTMMLAPTGVFERLLFLMGFEDTLCNFMLEPEAMMDLAMAIGEYRYKGFKLMVENAGPDAMLSHDDWGSKTNLFVQPELWRQIVKPAFVQSYNYLHDNGVLIVHHCDSYCEPIIEDMVELHIDVWQGVLPQNDIPAIQKQLSGRMALMGGIDAALIDKADSTEAQIRAEVRRVCSEYCKNGHFIPCITYGSPGTIFPHVDALIDDEIDRCSTDLLN